MTTHQERTRKTEMYAHIQHFYAEAWMRGACKSIAATMSAQLLASGEALTAERIVSLDKHHMTALHAASTQCHQRALDRVIQLQQNPRTRKILFKLYARYLCPKRAVADMYGDEGQNVALFFNIIVGRLFVGHPSLEGSIALWLQYPHIDRDPFPLFTLLIMDNVAKRMHNDLKALPHRSWMDTTTYWSNFTSLVQQSRWLCPKAKTSILKYVERVTTPTCFFDCEDPQCSTCLEYEHSLASDDVAGLQKFVDRRGQ
jgi:hypothetical protein